MSASFSAAERGRQDRVRAVLAQVGLASASRLFASRLSLGMARRAALARAFVIEPGLLLLDEPFVSLDEQTAGRLRLLLQDLLAMHHTTAILVTHNLREAAMLARRLICAVGIARPADRRRSRCR